MKENFRGWIKSGKPWIWLNAGMASAAIIMVVGLIIYIAVKGMGHFWPHAVVQFNYVDADGGQSKVLGEVVDEEVLSAARLKAIGMTPPPGETQVERVLIKTGNRDLTGADFQWFVRASMRDIERPPGVMELEREEWGNFIGFPVSLKEAGSVVATGDGIETELVARLERRNELKERIEAIEKQDIGAVNYRIEKIRRAERKAQADGVLDEQSRLAYAAERKELDASYAVLSEDLAKLNQQIERDSLVVRSVDGQEVEVPLAKIVRAYRPNAMGLLQKVGHYGGKIREFVTDDPREANTEGGIFPAIFGTVLMVMLMAVLVTPFGVIAAVYLSEYARQGPFTRMVRIAVNNLAGVPSVVYGVFGLGFFVYFLGGSIDELFFPEALPAPTFGTPGLMWAALTLALLTVPVVIVSTEEGLSRIPKSIREGSLALGATKAETLWRTVLPMATPGMMTGVILAIARAAGEVAPLMLVGVVKLAPSLPLDGNAPFLHLDRKFMHLGFHIYDVGFQSPNVEAARPLVYATAFLLVLVIVMLNLAAIRIRNRLREKYNAAES
jgi:phosphate transport system permease protein